MGAVQLPHVQPAVDIKAERLRFRHGNDTSSLIHLPQEVTFEIRIEACIREIDARLNHESINVFSFLEKNQRLLKFFFLKMEQTYGVVNQLNTIQKS